jgi:DNA (cytosine-5)-methyltransferase 1
VLSLCSGAGGLELGLKLAVPGSRTVCYVEGEAYAAAQLAARMEDETMDAAPVWSDVKTFDPAPWRGCVDIVTAGYPCQPFSIAGAKRAEKDPRHLWPFIREIVRSIEPRLCFFENVSHHLRLGFEQVHDDLRSMGFSVAAGLFTAEEVGAPHRRERLFILAHAEGAGAWLDQFNARQGAGGNGQSVADPDGAGLERQSRHEAAPAGSDFTTEHGFPLWPPGPGELETWGIVPDALKPAVHRMADGMAYRVDRLRACGNGVVPLVAAYAFRTLVSAISS